MPDFLNLAEFKKSLKLDGNEQDWRLITLLDVAEGYLGSPTDGILGRPLVVTAFSERFDDFDAVDLAHPDGARVTAVTYLDTENQAQTLGGLYDLIAGRFELRPGFSWPSHSGKITVEYEAGFDVVPAAICEAGYFYAGTLYEGQADAANMKPDMLRKLMAQMVAGYRRRGL